jgi:macrolide-specific efflux system membrane fusion protein
VYAGATATASITTKHVANVLEIPTFAITYNGSTASVRVKSGSSTSTRTITVGTSYGLETQVLSGLKAGEDVDVTIPTFPGRPTGGTGSNEGPSVQGVFPGEGGGTFPSGSGPGAFSGNG